MRLRKFWVRARNCVVWITRRFEIRGWGARIARVRRSGSARASGAGVSRSGESSNQWAWGKRLGLRWWAWARSRKDLYYRASRSAKTQNWWRWSEGIRARPCEKPLAATAEQAARMVEACRRNRVLLMTAYRKYFEPSSLYLRQLIQNGELGRIDVIHTAFSELYSSGKSLPWLVDSNLAGGGPLMDLGVYCVNTTRWMVDEDPAEVSAQSWARDTVTFWDVEEGISFRMQFPSGLVVQASASYGAVLSSFIYVQGTKGWASLTPAFPFDEVRRLTGKISKRAIDRTFPIIDEFGPELNELASAIQNRRPVESDGVQGHRDMVILESIYNSARKQRPVVINY